jgi:hypothetical protein
MLEGSVNFSKKKRKRFHSPIETCRFIEKANFGTRGFKIVMVSILSNLVPVGWNVHELLSLTRSYGSKSGSRPKVTILKLETEYIFYFIFKDASIK